MTYTLRGANALVRRQIETLCESHEIVTGVFESLYRIRKNLVPIERKVGGKMNKEASNSRCGFCRKSISPRVVEENNELHTNSLMIQGKDRAWMLVCNIVIKIIRGSWTGSNRILRAKQEKSLVRIRFPRIILIED